MRTLSIFVLCSAFLLVACSSSKQNEPKESAAPSVDRALLSVFSPAPQRFESEANPLTPEKIELGKHLYYDTRLSKNHDVACNSCHLLDKYGVDGTPTSTGHKGQKGGRNAPTVYNAAGHIAQFWDGRAPTVEEQAKGPILNPIEMAMPDEAQVLATLKAIPGYVERFKTVFPKSGITYDNMAQAIGAFERTLSTQGPWDEFLSGKDEALNAQQKQGLLVYLDTGCAACHSGALLGGSMYQKLGLVKPWPNTSDTGRGALTKNEADAMMFKVPSLRNIAQTGPYFHDGSVPDLSKAVSMMAEHQNGKSLSAEQVQQIVTFLGAFTGSVPKEALIVPEPLPAGEGLPAPDPS